MYIIDNLPQALEIMKDPSAMSLKFDGGNSIEIEVVEQVCKMEPATVWGEKVGEPKYYEIPCCTMQITPRGIKYFPNEYTNTKEGWWGQQVHPHVNELGDPCWGNIDGDVAMCCSQHNWDDAFKLGLEFLRSVNVDDVAGAAVCRWDEVNEFGELLERGHDPKGDEYYNGWTDSDALERYSNLGTTRDGRVVPIDELNECQYCYELVAEDEGMILECEGFVCNDCIENYMVTCDCCGQIVDRGNTDYLDNGDIVCMECLENNYIWCDECMTWVEYDEWNKEKEMCDRCAEELIEPVDEIYPILESERSGLAMESLTITRAWLEGKEL